MDARVDAYVPAAYIGSEALKIDLHRRLALVEDEDELRELRASSRTATASSPTRSRTCSRSRRRS